MTQKCKELVTEFHKLNGNAVNAKESTPKLAVLRTRLVLEELAETYAALHDNDVLETADGLTDLLYVVVGTAVAYGTPLNDFFTVTKCAPVNSFEAINVIRFGARMLPLVTSMAAALSTKTAGNLGAVLQSMSVAINAAGAGFGFPMEELFAEVHRSNMSKTFALNIGDAKYGVDKKGVINPKGPGYSPPDIAGILTAARKRFA